MFEQEQIRDFSRVLRRIGMLFMRVAGRQSTEHVVFSKQELLALGVLGVNGACRMGEIAAYLGVGQSAVTPLVDRLEDQGVVERRRSKEDRRVWLVALTEKGDAVLATEDKVYEEVAREMLAPLDPEERTTLIALLERVGSVAAEG
jgi:DNA-binding MarR family transcriptional regulator